MDRLLLMIVTFNGKVDDVGGWQELYSSASGRKDERKKKIKGPESESDFKRVSFDSDHQNKTKKKDKN